MANSDIFTVTTSWSAVEANGEDITRGIFTVWGRERKRVGLIKSSSLPTKANGNVWLEEIGESHKFSLLMGENLYAKSDTTDVNITVEPA